MNSFKPVIDKFLKTTGMLFLKQVYICIFVKTAVKNSQIIFVLCPSLFFVKRKLYLATKGWSEQTATGQTSLSNIKRGRGQACV